MKKSLHIIHYAFEKDLNFIIQSFFIYPRFYIEENSLLYFRLNNYLKSKYLGDNFNNLVFIKETNELYKNGILKTIIYNKLKDFKFKEIKEKIRINYTISEDYNCQNCEFNIDNFCYLWGKQIIKKNKCFFWSEIEKYKS